MQIELTTSKLLLQWYLLNKRDLPWRNTHDPYKIWISEIILQQTRVNQGLDYYLRFIDAFPNVKALAEAHLDEVLKLWQGLGYYSRARNLHFAAQQIESEYNGTFPSSYAELLKLKGVGKYTASAIASIAFDENVPLVDGNVYRVISRFYGLDVPIDSSQSYSIYAKKAFELMGREHAGTFNQALMELGALICSPTNPDCAKCPLQQFCVAEKDKLWEVLPIKQKIKSVRTRYFYYIVVVSGNNILVKQREDQDIWQGLFDFPLIETNKAISVEELLVNSELKDICEVKAANLHSIYGPVKHQLTHQTLQISFITFHINENVNMLNRYLVVPKDSLINLAVPVPIERFLKNEFDIFK